MSIHLQKSILVHVVFSIFTDDWGGGAPTIKSGATKLKGKTKLWETVNSGPMKSNLRG